MRHLGFLLCLAAGLIACDTKVPIATSPPTTPSSTTGAPDCLDADADGICDDEDPCHGDHAFGDTDADGMCNDLDSDDDNDGCDDAVDAAPQAASPDTDGDGTADDCDDCPEDAADDSDGDTVCDGVDICAGFDDLLDTDGDTAPDGCDPCPDDPNDDSDGDSICDSDDLCPGYDDQIDTDGDANPDDCDPCPLDINDDSDFDGICDSDDICPYGDDNLDGDGDGVADGCDPCPLDNPDDTDGDGVCDTWDACPGYIDGAFDADGDGYDIASGDCNDCEPLIGPDAFDIPGSLIDENCDGVVDEPRSICDAGLAVADNDPMNAAAAMDMCDTVAVVGHGVQTAGYVRAAGAATVGSNQSGLVGSWGNTVVPQHGNSMLVLSSGVAREFGAPGACGADSCVHGGGVPPAGFPQNVPGCQGGIGIADDIGIEIDLVAPANATGLRMQFYFMSFEFPEWVCTRFNDQFILLMSPPPVGAINGNIAFDSNTNPVSVNVGFQPVCNPGSWPSFAANCLIGCPSLPVPYCADGPGDLAGTGFAEWQNFAGGTDWLEVTAPVTPGSAFTLRFAIWDTGDANLDSTVLIDDFEWVAEPVDVGVQPGGN